MTRIPDIKHTAMHTPEPWHIDGKGDVRSKQPSDYEYHRLVATIADKDRLVSRDNARRICAAVNACKGIPTEALEQGVVSKLRHALETFLEFNDQWLIATDTQAHLEHDRVMQMARTAIAEAKGDAQ